MPSIVDGMILPLLPPPPAAALSAAAADTAVPLPPPLCRSSHAGQSKVSHLRSDRPAPGRRAGRRRRPGAGDLMDGTDKSKKKR